MDRVNRRKLLQILDLLKPGLTTRDEVEQSSCYVFHDGYVYAYNDNVFCCHPIDFEIEGAFPARPFRESLKKLPDDDLRIEDGDELIIRGSRRKVGLTKQPVAAHIQNLELPEDWGELPADFTESAKLVLSCVSENNEREDLRCVHFTPNYVEACDTIQLIRCSIPVPVDDPFLIEGQVLQAICHTDNDELTVDRRWAYFRGPLGLVVACRLYQDEYPDLGALLQEEKGVPLQLPKSVKDSAELAELFSQEGGENALIQLDLKPGKLVITGEGLYGWYRETKDIDYEGEVIHCRLFPRVLQYVVDRDAQVQLGKSRLLITGVNYRYVACLTRED